MLLFTVDPIFLKKEELGENKNIFYSIS